MGRELRRKENKKNKKVNINKEVDANISLISTLKITSVIIVLLVLLYYGVAIFITKELQFSWNKDKEEEIDNTVSNKILAKNIFNQKEEKYYVYFYDFTKGDDLSSTLTNLDLTIYRVDTSSALNSNYVTEDNTNKNVTSIDNLKVKSPTVIEINNDKVTSYYEGISEIVDAFN